MVIGPATCLAEAPQERRRGAGPSNEAQVLGGWWARVLAGRMLVLGPTTGHR